MTDITKEDIEKFIERMNTPIKLRNPMGKPYYTDINENHPVTLREPPYITFYSQMEYDEWRKISDAHNE